MSQLIVIKVVILKVMDQFIMAMLNVTIVKIVDLWFQYSYIDMFLHLKIEIQVFMSYINTFYEILAFYFEK